MSPLNDITEESSGNSTAAAHVPQNDGTVQIAIAGGGIVGLTLALCLKEHVPAKNVQITIYEKAHSFADDVGAGLGLYPNGLRVLRDVRVLEDVTKEGYPYVFRRWTRHDGTTVAVAQESVLARSDEDAVCNQELLESNKKEVNEIEEEEKRIGSEKEDQAKLQSHGIRRWRFQKVLFEAVQKVGIPVVFNKFVQKVECANNEEQKDLMKLIMQDGTNALAHIVLAADGGKSSIREQVVQQKYDSVMKAKGLNPGKCPLLVQQMMYTKRPILPHLKYTGVTCLMGIAENTPQEELTSDAADWRKNHFRGICFPSSSTTDCHAVFFPTGPTEQCFQFHFPVSKAKADPGNWGTLTDAVGKEECKELAERLREDGWHEAYLQPLANASNAVRIGFCLLEPKGLDQFVYRVNEDEAQEKKSAKRIVLLGDAAHPPVPYIGQGAQMGLEDAGTFALLMKHYCLNAETMHFSFDQFDEAMSVFEHMRIPRTTQILQNSKDLGKKQEMRASRLKHRRACLEERTKRDVFFHETLPIMFPGAQYDYRKAVEGELKKRAAKKSKEDADLKEKQHMPALEEEKDEPTGEKEVSKIEVHAC